MRHEEFDDDELQEDDESSPEPRPRRRPLFRVIRFFVILGAVWFIGLCLFIDLYGRFDQAQHAQVIVILGSRVEADGRLGDSLRERTLQAVALYKRGLANKIICTGGRAYAEPVTEALAASNFAIKQGVTPGDLFLETTSTDTWENAVNAAAICRKEGWTHVVVVSDPYHLWRANRDFRAQGLTPYTSPARNCLRNRKILMRLQWTAREGLAVTRDLAFDAGRWVKGKL